MTIFSEVLIFAAFWLFAVLSTLFYMHMFQLNSYRADDQWHWMLKNRGKVVPLALPLIGAIIGVICGKNAGMIVCAVFVLLACLFYKPKKGEKAAQIYAPASSVCSSPSRCSMLQIDRPARGVRIRAHNGACRRSCCRSFAVCHNPRQYYK